MRISDMDRKSKRDFLESAYDSATAAHENGSLAGAHPSRQILAWAKLGAGRTDDNVVENSEIDDEAIPGEPNPPGGNRGGKPPTVDGHYQLGMDSVPRFFKPDGSVVIGDKALELRARQNGDTTAMHRMIPGYGRIR